MVVVVVERREAAQNGKTNKWRKKSRDGGGGGGGITKNEFSSKGEKKNGMEWAGLGEADIKTESRDSRRGSD